MTDSPQNPRRLWRLGLILPLVWVLVGLLFATQLVTFDYMPISDALRFASVDWLPWIIVSPGILWLGTHFEITSESWKRNVPLHIAACVLVTLLMEFSFRAAIHYNFVMLRHPMGFGNQSGMMPPPNAGDMPPGASEQQDELPPMWMLNAFNGETKDSQAGERTDDTSKVEKKGPQPLPSRTVKASPGSAPSPSASPSEKPWDSGPDFGPGRMPMDANWGKSNTPSLLRTPRARMTMPLYWVLIAAAHAAAYHRRSIERERRAMLAEAKLAEARMAMLQSQINPHFLFNTLNAIAQYVHEDADATESMIVDLSKLLRASLAASEIREVSLQRELELAQNYLAIQQRRFPDKLSVDWQLSPDTLAIHVPTLALQPLIENAVIHGIAPRKVPGHLVIRSLLEREELVVEVIDSGSGEGAARAGELLELKREGIGISNTRARLASLYGEKASLSLSWHAMGGVCSRLRVPLKPKLS